MRAGYNECDYQVLKIGVYLQMEISLALGAGGLRGVAHIGVLRALETHGFTVKAIAGTSAGGLVGAVYAAGYSTESFENIFIQ